MASSRKDLSLTEKLDVLDKIKTYPPGTSQTKLSRDLHISRRTVARLIASEKELRQNLSHGNASSQKRRRCGKDEEVETALKDWMLSVREHNQTVTGPLLKNKAEEFGERLGKTFVATEGWLQRWKNRNHIVYKRAHCEKSSAISTNAIVAQDDIRACTIPLIHAEKFVAIDNDVEYSSVMTNVEDEIVNKILANRLEKKEGSDSENDVPVASVSNSNQQVSYSRAKSCVHDLYSYGLLHGLGNDFLSKLDFISATVTGLAAQSNVQLLLDCFLNKNIH